MKGLIEILMFAAIFLMIAMVSFGLSKYGCASRWSQSGLVTSWGPWQGCLVGPPGKLVPEKNYRELP